MDVRTLELNGQSLRVAIRPGQAEQPPLLLFNGVGANLELLAPFVAVLDRAIPVLTFDVPGVGGSPAPRLPYRFSGLARLGQELLPKLGYQGAADVLGVSWGGAVAQQFARSFPTGCRRLVLAATSAGAVLGAGEASATLQAALAARHPR